MSTEWGSTGYLGPMNLGFRGFIGLCHRVIGLRVLTRGVARVEIFMFRATDKGN